MDTWIYFIHPPRDDFAETMTDVENEVWGRHWARIQRLFDEGSIVLVGPTLGPINYSNRRQGRGHPTAACDGHGARMASSNPRGPSELGRGP